MEPLESTNKLDTLGVTKKIQLGDPIGSTKDSDDLPISDKKISLVKEEEDQTKDSEDLSSKTLDGEGTLDSPEIKEAKNTLQSNISKGMKRITSFGVTLERDVRQEQLTQLIAAKIREGELMLELSSKNAWVKENETPVWTVHTKKQGQTICIRNELKLNCSYSIAKALLIEYRKKRQVNLDNNEPSSQEKTSSICSINYERSTSIEPTDYLILRLERQTKEGCFKVAEMSIEDRRCPVIPGVRRGHLELRYWHIAPDETDENCCKLWVIEAVKLKNKEDDSEIKLALEKNKYLVQKILNEAKF